MEYIAVLKNYLEYSLILWILLTETYTKFFFCIFISAFIFVKKNLLNILG